jgi:predicted membrane metal-binding protein
MRSTWVSGLLFVLLLIGAVWGGSLASVFAQRPAVPPMPEQTSSAGGGVISHLIELADGRQQITLIDTRTRAIAVYQIDSRTSAISLKSVRNVNWDLQMDEFNSGGNPSPKEIRALLEQR